MHPHVPVHTYPMRLRRGILAATGLLRGFAADGLPRAFLTAATLLVALTAAACQPGEGEGEGASDVDETQEREEQAAFDAEVPSEGDAMQRPFIGTAGQDPYGEYLVNREGQVLYVFTPDSAGEPTCYEDCAQAWPPYLAEAGEARIDESLDQDLPGTVERRDGQLQVTWAGWPLYFYAQDRSDAPTGQGIRSHGGEWYLMGPSGRMIMMEPPEGEGADTAGATAPGGAD